MNLTISTGNDYEDIKNRIFTIITKYSKEHDLAIEQSTLQQLSIHLAIAMIRIESNNYIPLSSSILNDYKHDENYFHAKKICENIANEFQLEIAENEIALVAMHLAKGDYFETEFFTGLDIIDEDIIHISKKAIDNIYDKYHVDFRNDEKLLVNMSLHLLPAIDRLQKNDFSKNPLTKEIKERHSVEFNYAKVLNETVDQTYHKSFNDDELAFLTLYFVLATNRMNQNI